MSKRTPSPQEIDALMHYVCNRINWTDWFSLKGGHGHSIYDCLPFYVEDACAAEFAVRLGFLEMDMRGGSAGYVVYRLTRSGFERYSTSPLMPTNPIDVGTPSPPCSAA